MMKTLMPNVIHKPWGHERIISKTDKYVVKEIYVKPNARLSLQYHNKKTETMFLVSGKGYLDCVSKSDRETYSSQRMHRLKPYEIPPGVIHRLYTKDEDCLVIEVSSTELDDVVRLEDDYGRE